MLNPLVRTYNSNFSHLETTAILKEKSPPLVPGGYVEGGGAGVSKTTRQVLCCVVHETRIASCVEGSKDEYDVRPP